MCVLPGPSRPRRPWAQTEHAAPAACSPSGFSRYSPLTSPPPPPPPPPTATPTVQTCALEGKTVRSNVDALDHLELVVYLVSAPVSFITNLNYLACPCGFPAVPGGALAHSLGTIKTMVGMALEFHLLRVSSMAVLPSLLPVAVSKILAVVQIILKPWGQPISPHSNLYDSTARDLITL